MMINFESLETVILEITNRCQASCPMCNRNLFGGLSNPNIKLNSWSLDDYKKIINEEVLFQIKEVQFCGNFGDCIINSDFLEMCRYTSQTNPNIFIRIFTNGSMRTTYWWKELASVLPEQHIVNFALDGLEDTHSLYRIGTDYNKIIENAKSFIDNGGIAEWAMIRFDHNAHQVAEAKKISKELGFKLFSIKDSNRFSDGRQKVVDKKGNFLYYLYPYNNSKIKSTDKKTVDDFYKNINSMRIECEAQNYKQVDIDCHGDLYPCCFTSGIPYNYLQRDELLYSALEQAKKEHRKIIKKIGGMDKINTKKYSIKEILNNKKLLNAYLKSWKNNELIICSKTCGKCDKKLFFSSKEQEQRIDEK